MAVRKEHIRSRPVTVDEEACLPQFKFSAKLLIALLCSSIFAFTLRSLGIRGFCNTSPNTVAYYFFQALVALPLFLPFPSIRSPTIGLFHVLTVGPGAYVGVTLLATCCVLLASSIWQGVSLQREEHENQYKSMMSAVQLAQAQLVIALCCANILIAFILSKLSLVMCAHSKLLASHTALTKQAAGISKEYTRAAQMDPNALLKEQLDEATKRCSDMQSTVDCEQADKQAAQKELSDVMMQLKSLERSFDELMKQNMAGGTKKPQPAAPVGTDDGFDDFMSENVSGAPRSRLAASRSKDA